MGKSNFLIPAMISAMFCFFHSCNQKPAVYKKSAADSIARTAASSVAIKH